MITITKTRLCNFDPLQPHFYIVKQGFTGVYIIFLICFEQKYEKYQNFLSENFPFLVIKFSIYLYRCVFVMSIKRILSTNHIIRILGVKSFLYSYATRSLLKVTTINIRSFSQGSFMGLYNIVFKHVELIVMI